MKSVVVVFLVYKHRLLYLFLAALRREVTVPVVQFITSAISGTVSISK